MQLVLVQLGKALHWRHRTRRERRLPEGHFKPEVILNLVIVAVKQVSLV